MNGRPFKIYKDESGKVFARFDDMMPGWEPKSCVGALQVIQCGTAISFANMVEQESQFIHGIKA